MTCDKCQHSLLCWSSPRAPTNWIICPTCHGVMFCINALQGQRKQYWHYWQCENAGEPSWMVFLRTERTGEKKHPLFVVTGGGVSHGYCVRCHPENWRHLDRAGKPFARVANLDVPRDHWRRWRERLKLSMSGVTTNIPESGLLKYNVEDSAITSSMIYKIYKTT